MSRVRKSGPTFLIAVLVLVLSVTGAAVAGKGTAPKNSVTSKSVKNGTLKSPDVKNNSLKGRDVKGESLKGKDVKDGSLGGEDVKDGSLGGEDVAANALTGDQIDESTLVGVDADKVDGLDAECGPGTEPFVGDCWETAARTATGWKAAAAACATAGGRLPDTGSLVAFAGQVTLAGTDEWTDQIIDVTAMDTFTAVTVSAAGAINFTAHNDPKGYRCVLPLLA